MVQSIYNPGTNAAIETGQDGPDVLKLVDGQGPGYIATPPPEQTEETGFNFSDDPLEIVAQAPKAPGVPWWVWALIALGVINLFKGGRK